MRARSIQPVWWHEIQAETTKIMNRYCLAISGDLACFTRPEMKVERVSYDIITPSAA